MCSLPWSPGRTFHCVTRAGKVLEGSLVLCVKKTTQVSRQPVATTRKKSTVRSLHTTPASWGGKSFENNQQVFESSHFGCLHFVSFVILCKRNMAVASDGTQARRSVRGTQARRRVRACAEDTRTGTGNPPQPRANALSKLLKKLIFVKAAAFHQEVSVRVECGQM